MWKQINMVESVPENTSTSEPVEVKTPAIEKEAEENKSETSATEESKTAAATSDSENSSTKVSDELNAN